MSDDETWQPAARELLAQAEVEYDRAHGRFDAIDGKAGLTLGFAAALLGLTVDVARSDAIAVVLLGLGRGGLVVSLVASLVAAWPRKIRVLNIDTHRERLEANGADETLKDRLRDRTEDVRTTAAAARTKRVWLEIALITITIAAVALGAAAQLN